MPKELFTENRAVLVTGASSGIGRSCALYLEKLGYRVFAGVRSGEDAVSLKTDASPNLTPVSLDVTDLNSIKSARDNILAETGDKGLWGLVNNAGISSNGPLEFYPLEEVRRIFEVNVFGLLAVTQAFLPLIRKGKGRIINISSVSAMMAFPFAGPYCASKNSVEVFSQSLRAELSIWKIPVSVIEPASIASGMWSKSDRSTRELIQRFPQEGQHYYGAILGRLNQLNSQQGGKSDPPTRIARLVAKILVSPRPKVLYREGKLVFFLRCLKLLPEGVRSALLMSQLRPSQEKNVAGK